MSAIVSEILTDSLKSMNSRFRSNEMKSPFAQYSIGDPEYEELAKTLPGPLPVPRPAIQEQRIYLTRFTRARLEKDPGPQEGLTVRERKIEANSTEILIRTYVPEPEPSTATGQLYPLLVWLHGGGFCTGDLDTNDDLCRSLCVENRVSVVNVDYRLAPEFPFPAGIYDSFDALKWAIKNAKELSADPELGVIVAGNSSGANYAIALTLLARDDEFFKSNPITGQLALIPTTCAPAATPAKWADQLKSRTDLYDAPGLDKHAIKQYTDSYAPATGPQPFNPLVSPLLAETHVGLPPTYFQIAGIDPLRDEGLVYEKVLKASGVPTRIDIYPGVPHGFMRLPIKASEKHREDLRNAIDWLKSFSVS